MNLRETCRTVVVTPRSLPSAVLLLVSAALVSATLVSILVVSASVVSAVLVSAVVSADRMTLSLSTDRVRSWLSSSDPPC